VVRKNTVRLAEVWLDDFKNYYYERIQNQLGDYGDVSSRKSLRNSLECKSFAWYLQNIFPSQFIPGESQHFGEVSFVSYGVCKSIVLLETSIIYILKGLILDYFNSSVE